MKPITWLLLISLLVTNAAWSYMYIDRAARLEQLSNELERGRRITALLASLMVEIPDGANPEEVQRLLRQLHPELITKVRGDTLEAGEIIFEFQNSSLQRVSTM